MRAGWQEPERDSSGCKLSCTGGSVELCSQAACEKLLLHTGGCAIAKKRSELSSLFSNAKARKNFTELCRVPC